ncbi:MAG TPA: cation transporter [Candidatus Oscillibacter pullicola]|uniref:heavy-metal-associated domain-containing protein n=1 Tax=uncultured Oscillibacter sp. TaxID=876091 RepID=UPI001F93430D|nr:cation transporter [uncultured Oscillibacter sp.]HJB51857.1 cation transporter [Candidatus Oscillibacter pullicola]
MASISVSLDRNADRHDVKLLKRELDTLPGVTSVSVSSGGQLAVDYDATGVRQADILEKIQALGYRVRQEHA